MLVRLKQAAYSVLVMVLDEAVEHCADNFLQPPPPTGLSLFLPRLRDSRVLAALVLSVCSVFGCLAAHNTHSPKLTALEMRDGSSTFLLVHGRTLKMAGS